MSRGRKSIAAATVIFVAMLTGACAVPPEYRFERGLASPPPVGASFALSPGNGEEGERTTQALSACLAGQGLREVAEQPDFLVQYSRTVRRGRARLELAQADADAVSHDGKPVRGRMIETAVLVFTDLRSGQPGYRLRAQRKLRPQAEPMPPAVLCRALRSDPDRQEPAAR